MDLVPEEKAFIWKTKKGSIKVQTLQELLSILIDINEEEIQDLININIINGQVNIKQWLKLYFSDHQELIFKFENKGGLLPSQLRENLIECLQEEIYMR